MLTLNDFVPVGVVAIKPIMDRIQEHGLNKEGLRIFVEGYISSPLARDYYNISFYGFALPHDGLKKEIVRGCFEVNKKDGGWKQDNIRLQRFLRSEEHFRELISSTQAELDWLIEQRDICRKLRGKKD
jgi:hypothetical protein